MSHLTAEEDGFTLIELLIVVVIIGIIAAIGLPGFLRARISGNEASAIASLRAINTAQQGYAQVCNGFAVVLTQLGTAGPGGAQPFLSPDTSGAATVSKSGYSVTMAAGAGGVVVASGPCAGAAQSNFYATAVPLTLGSTGTRGFATNNTWTVFQDTSGAAPSEPFTVGGTVSAIQ